MDEQKTIEITTATRGKLVCAKGVSSNSKWLILIKNTQTVYSRWGEDIRTSLRINSHVSIGYNPSMIYVNEIEPGFWGYTNDYLFFEPTEEEKMEVINLLKSKGLKFVSVLNKLVRVVNYGDTLQKRRYIGFA